jgi:hypothetical protein
VEAAPDRDGVGVSLDGIVNLAVDHYGASNLL